MSITRFFNACNCMGPRKRSSKPQQNTSSPTTGNGLFSADTNNTAKKTQSDQPQINSIYHSKDTNYTLTVPGRKNNTQLSDETKKITQKQLITTNLKYLNLDEKSAGRLKQYLLDIKNKKNPSTVIDQIHRKGSFVKWMFPDKAKILRDLECAAYNLPPEDINKCFNDLGLYTPQPSQSISAKDASRENQSRETQPDNPSNTLTTGQRTSVTSSNKGTTLLQQPQTQNSKQVDSTPPRHGNNSRNSYLQKLGIIKKDVEERTSNKQNTTARWVSANTSSNSSLPQPKLNMTAYRSNRAPTTSATPSEGTPPPTTQQVLPQINTNTSTNLLQQSQTQDSGTTKSPENLSLHLSSKVQTNQPLNTHQPRKSISLAKSSQIIQQHLGESNITQHPTTSYDDDDGGENFFSSGFTHTSTVFGENNEPTSGPVQSPSHPFKKIMLNNGKEKTEVSINVMSSSILILVERITDTTVAVTTEIDKIQVYNSVTSEQSYTKITDTEERIKIIELCIGHIYKCMASYQFDKQRFILHFDTSDSAQGIMDKFKATQELEVNNQDTNSSINNSHSLRNHPTIPESIFVDSNRIKILSPDVKLPLTIINTHKNVVYFDITVPTSQIDIVLPPDDNQENMESETKRACHDYISNMIQHQLTNQTTHLLGILKIKRACHDSMTKMIKHQPKDENNPKNDNLQFHLTQESHNDKENTRKYQFGLTLHTEGIAKNFVNSAPHQINITIPQAYSAVREKSGNISIKNG